MSSHKQVPDDGEAPTPPPTEEVTQGETPSGPQQVLPKVDTSPTDTLPDDAAGTPKEGQDDDAVVDPNAYHVKLEGFEGPLDLLLHLIRKHELDILDIPVSFITEKYLDYIKMMDSLAIDVASEYLVMAATLAHIKSKMLLPPDPNALDDDGALEELDPRSELVRRLLEYQKYKDAAATIRERTHLGLDAFERGIAEITPEGQAPLAPFSVFKLFDALDRVLKRANQTMDHQVLFDRVSLADRIVELTELLQKRRRVRFDLLFFDEKNPDAPAPSTIAIVTTFLAILEMCKMRVARITQDDPLEELFVEVAKRHLRPDDPALAVALSELTSDRATGHHDEAAAAPQAVAAPEGAPQAVAAPEVTLGSGVASEVDAKRDGQLDARDDEVPAMTDSTTATVRGQDEDR